MAVDNRVIGYKSPSVRRAWIEIPSAENLTKVADVALREEGVD